MDNRSFEEKRIETGLRLGIAPDNAPDSVKTQATSVAPSNDEACVAWAIERFVL